MAIERNEVTLRTDAPRVTKAERSLVSELAAYAERVRDGYATMAREAPTEGTRWGFLAKSEAWAEITVCLQQSVIATMTGKAPYDPKTVGETLLQQMRQRADYQEAVRAEIEAARNGNGGLDTKAAFAQDEEV